MGKIVNTRVIKNDKIAQQDIYKMTVEWNEGGEPGQFVMIDCKGNTLLKRPFSIHSLTNNSLSILYQVKGKGTKNLSLFQNGDSINIIGPLGNGFQITSHLSRAILIGGGIGIAPLFFLAERLQSKGIKLTILLGFQASPYLLNEFKGKGELLVSTEDGSYGERGTIKNLVEKVNVDKYDIIYGCGPKSLLKFIKTLSEKKNIPCQISLEERMGCGIGACLSCVCKIKDSNGWHYERVCKEGPVFWAEKVIL